MYAIERGWTWAPVVQALGVTSQAAWKKHAVRRDQVPSVDQQALQPGGSVSLSRPAGHRPRQEAPDRPFLLRAGAMVAGCGPDDSASALETSTSAALGARSDDILGRLFRPGEPGCSAAVGIEGIVAWAGACGVADLATGTLLTPGSVFDIASVSKQFTAAAILMLAQAGKLKLTDPVATHLDGLPDWSNDVTIEQLIHHTSGIPDYIGLLLEVGYRLTDRTTQAQAVAALASTPDLRAQPGARFEYSNSNYLLLAEIAHTVSGKPLPELLRSNVFEPLHLDMTMDPLAQGPLTAISYTKDPAGDQWFVADSDWAQLGDGSIQTTPSQLVRWADNYRTGAVGGAQLLCDQTEAAVETEPGAGRYGAGIFISPDNTLSHVGVWGGFTTLFEVSADRTTSIAISCNTPDADIAGIATGLKDVWT
jgi:CubicO group peptidase (beta-lactamase class C family)